MGMIQRLQIMALEHVGDNPAGIAAIGRTVETAMGYQSPPSTALHGPSQAFHNLLCLSEILPQGAYQIKPKAESLEQSEQSRPGTRYSRRVYTGAISLLAPLTVIART